MRNEKTNVKSSVFLIFSSLSLMFSPPESRDTSGIKIFMTDERKANGKNKSGITIPRITPYFPIASIRFEPYNVKQYGIIRLSNV